MDKQEYDRLMRERNEILAENKARRMRKRPLATPTPLPLSVPPKPQMPLVPVAYRIEDGAYEGRLNDPDECPAECFVKWEPASW